MKQKIEEEEKKGKSEWEAEFGKTNFKKEIVKFGKAYKIDNMDLGWIIGCHNEDISKEKKETIAEVEKLIEEWACSRIWESDLKILKQKLKEMKNGKL